MNRLVLRRAIAAALTVVVIVAAVVFLVSHAGGNGGDHGEDHATGGHDLGHSAHAGTSGIELTDSRNGLTMQLRDSSVDRGRVAIAFSIVTDNGDPVLAYDLEYTKPMHLIVVRDDLAAASYLHLHPRLTKAGTWVVSTTLDMPGTYRAIADFMPSGKGRTVLATSLRVAGTPPVRAELPVPVRTQRVDGYDVALDADDLEPGQDGLLRVQVSRMQEPVTLEPILGAYGHAVLLREGDLAYLHVHPDSAAPRRGVVTFAATLPSAASYVAFIQFAAGGSVHTATVTVDAGGPG